MKFLKCNRCGCENVHTKSVRIFAHDEDATCIAISVSDIDSNHHRVDSCPSLACPSPRRQAIEISLHCEECGPVQMRIVQHKGTEFIEGDVAIGEWL